MCIITLPLAPASLIRLRLFSYPGESDGHLNPDVILVMTELLNYKEEDIVKVVTGGPFSPGSS